MLLASSLILSLPVALPPAADGCKASKAAMATTASYEHKDIVDTAVAAGNVQDARRGSASRRTSSTRSSRDGSVHRLRPDRRSVRRAARRARVETLLKPENKATPRKSILTYHVVPSNVMAKDVVELTNATTLNGQRVDVRVTDSGVTIDGATVVKTDIACSNGTIHVIDAVILPNTEDIVATAVKAGSFKTLAAALDAAGLVEALQGDGPFTVFAPTDEAFAALPEGTVASLLEPQNKAKLAAVLKYHVIPGRVYSETAAAGAEVVTLQGQSIHARSANGKVMINEANVVQADLETSNGVIHVIDRVLLPE